MVRLVFVIDIKSLLIFVGFGNLRGFENFFLFMFGVIFFCWYNYIVNSLKDVYGEDDECLFEEVRRRVIVYY